VRSAHPTMSHPCPTDRELLEVAREAAHRAGEVLMGRLWGPRRVTPKGYRDALTDADTAAEEVVLSLIRARFPTHAVISEEAGGTEGGSPFVWLVDPLDGTTNYSRGQPTFSVSIAALREGEPLVGVVHDPVRGHTFVARRGGGAALNGRPLSVSRTGRLEEALVGLDWARADEDRAEVLWRLRALAPRCRTVRALGSAALALSYVAAGWMDLYFATGLFPWDVAAATLILTEAGGRVGGWEGGPWRLGERALLATNGLLDGEVLAVWGRGGP